MSTITNIVQDKQEIKYQLSEQNPDVVPAAQIFTENIEFREIVTKYTVKQIAGAMIWGSDEFGIWGTSEWGSGTDSSFILNSAEFGVLGQNSLGAGGASESLYAVIPRNNIFVEYFGQDEYIDTSATTATLDTVNEEIVMADGEILQSEVIAKLREPITSVKLLANDDLKDEGGGMVFPFTLGSDTFADNNIKLEFSNDGGSTWEEANESEIHTFSSSSASDELKYRMTATNAITITDPIAIQVNP